MDQSTFDAADPLLDQIAEAVENSLTSAQLADIRQLIAKLSQTMGERYLIGLNVFVEVFDQEREGSMTLLNTGLSFAAGKEPYQTWGDSTPQRYIVDGQIQVVPHDRCPKCWDAWDFKLQNRSCSHCGATLGDNCKILLDTDICPHCEKGKISMANPKCDQCGFQIETNVVVWG